MAIGYRAQSNRTTAYLNEYVCDYETDVANLPTQIAPGSTAIVIESGNVYVLNNQHQWKIFGGNGGSSGGGDENNWAAFEPGVPGDPNASSTDSNWSPMP